MPLSEHLGRQETILYVWNVPKVIILTFFLFISDVVQDDGKRVQPDAMEHKNSFQVGVSQTHVRGQEQNQSGSLLDFLAR